MSENQREAQRKKKKERNGGVWKKVKSKGMEESGRYIHVWRRKLGKNIKGKNIFYCVDILF